MTIGLSGLASGLDSEALIERLMALQRQPRTRMELEERFYEQRETTLGDVNTRLKNLRTAAADLASALAWGETQKVESADAGKVGAAQKGAVAAGSYTVAVSSLAQAEQRVFAFGAQPLAADATITLTQDDAGGTAYTVDLSAGMTAAQVASAISEQAGGLVTASVSGSDLVITGLRTGDANGFSVADGGALGAPGYAIDAADAAWSVNGVAGSSASNVVTAVPGLELTLKAPTAGVTVSVTEPASDTAKVKEKIEAFVEQYNSTIDFVRSKTSEKRVADAATSADAVKGVLYADTALNGLLSSLRKAMAENGLGAMDGLADLGVTTGAGSGGTSTAGSLAGKLVIDEAKLDAALANPGAVRSLLTGVSETVTGALDPYTSADGTIASRMREADAQAERLRDSMSRLDEKLALQEERLRAQYAALETLLSQSQAQQSWLSGQLAALNR